MANSEKVFVAHMIGKRLIYRISKWTPNNKTTDNPRGKWAKDMNRLFTENETRMFNMHLEIYLSSLLIKEIQIRK